MLYTGQKKYKVLAVLCFCSPSRNLIYKGEKLACKRWKKPLLAAEQGLRCIFMFSYSLKIPQHFFMAEIQRQPICLTQTGYKILQIMVIQRCPVHQLWWRQTFHASLVSCGRQLKLYFRITGFSRDTALQYPASNCRTLGSRISVHVMNFPVISFSKAATVYFSLFLANKSWAKGRLLIRLWSIDSFIYSQK